MKDFIKMFFASLLAIGAIAGCCLFFLMILAASGSQEPYVPDDAMLVLNLNHPIADKPPTSDFEGFVKELSGDSSNKVIPLRTLIDVIDSAANDSKIVGIYLHGNVNRENGYSGWGTLSEVKRALDAFKESGKPIYAYNMYWDEASLYLGSVATELTMNPFGAMQLNGFAAEIPYMKGALEKFGLEVQVTRVGKYKSAVEPFILEEMSEPNREQTMKYLGDLFDVFVTSVSKARNLPADTLYEFANTKAIAKGQEAVDQGFIDKLVYFDEALVTLKEMTGVSAKKKTFNQVSVSEYALANKGNVNRSKNKIAVIYAEGEIVDGHSDEMVGGASLSSLLRKARLDDKVKAVVLRVNSPGGSASASEEIQRETRLLKEEKPVIISMGSVAASGGYWISAYGNKIYAEPNTITGSIGVFGMFFNVKGLLNEHLGVNIQTVRTADLADLGTITRPKTEAELAVFQAYVDEIYESFISKVAEGRNLEKVKVEEIAQGRVWSGVEALNLGLVDELGGLQEAIVEAGAQADLDDYKIIQYQKTKTFTEKLLEDMGMGPHNAKAMAPIDREIQKFNRAKRALEAMNDPNGVYLRMPIQFVN